MHLGAHMKGGTIEVMVTLPIGWRRDDWRPHPWSPECGGADRRCVRGSLAGMKVETILIWRQRRTRSRHAHERGVIVSAAWLVTSLASRMKGGTFFCAAGRKLRTGALDVFAAHVSLAPILNVAQTFGPSCTSTQLSCGSTQSTYARLGFHSL